MNIDYTKLCLRLKHIGVTSLRGLVRTIYGAAVAGLIGVSIFGFIAITEDTGYRAVCDFIAACATLTVALCNMYYLGQKKPGKRGAA